MPINAPRPTYTQREKHVLMLDDVIGENIKPFIHLRIEHIYWMPTV